MELTGGIERVCDLSLGATLENIHLCSARDFIFLANLSAEALLGRMILTNFFVPLTSSCLMVCSIQQSLVSKFLSERVAFICETGRSLGMFRMYQISGRSVEFSVVFLLAFLLVLLLAFKWLLMGGVDPGEAGKARQPSAPPETWAQLVNEGHEVERLMGGTWSLTGAGGLQPAFWNV